MCYWNLFFLLKGPQKYPHILYWKPSIITSQYTMYSLLQSFNLYYTVFYITDMYIFDGNQILLSKNRSTLSTKIICLSRKYFWGTTRLLLFLILLFHNIMIDFPTLQHVYLVIRLINELIIYDFDNNKLNTVVLWCNELDVNGRIFT